MQDRQAEMMPPADIYSVSLPGKPGGGPRAAGTSCYLYHLYFQRVKKYKQITEVKRSEGITGFHL